MVHIYKYSKYLTQSWLLPGLLSTIYIVLNKIINLCNRDVFYSMLHYKDKDNDILYNIVIIIVYV